MPRIKYCLRKFSISLLLFPELRGLPYEARLEVLQLWTLEARRNRADLIELKYSTADDNLSAIDVAN